MTYRFREFAIRTQDRALLKNGETVPLTPKAADTLLLLLSRAGQVISKEEILAAVWPDSFVEEGSIARNIAALRKAFSDVAEEPRFIETIPKRGYRWIAPLDLSADPQGGSVQPSRRAAYVLAAALVFCTIVTTVIFATLWRRSNTPDLPAIRPFTTYVGGEFEPAFSPDGQSVAFVWNGEKQQFYDVYVRAIGTENLRRLTSDQSNKGSPAWSGDGKSIAFLRYGPDPKTSGVYVVPAAGGPERKITSTLAIRSISDRFLDWSPVKDEVALVDRPSPEDAFAIYTASTTSGTRHRITTAPSGIEGDTGPAYSRDGRSIAFRRTTSSAVNDLYIVPSSGGDVRRLTFDNQYTAAHAWSAAGSDLIFSSKRDGRSAVWRVSVSGGTPQLLLPVFAEFLAVARTHNRLAYSAWSADTNIWRFKLDELSRPDNTRLIASTRADMSPQYSPSGDKIAFRSDRTGANEIWVCDADGSNARAITSQGGPLNGSPRWSPDGQRLAFDSRRNGRSQIFSVSGSGGTTRQITGGEFDSVLPSWSHDGRFIYFASNSSGTWQVWKIGTEGAKLNEHPVQVTHQGGFAPFESADGRYVYYAKGRDTAGLWRAPANGGLEEVVLADLKPNLWGYWALIKDRIIYVDSAPEGPAGIISFDLSSGKRSRLGQLPKAPVWGDSGLAVSPDGCWLLFAQADTSGSDIYLVENFR